MPVLAPADPRLRTDLQQLQGSWVSVAGPCEARLLVAGNRYAFEFVGGDVYIGTFDLDPSAEPRRMDMHVEEGPDADKGRTGLCIYHLDGGVLRWCPAKPGSGRRQPAFPSVDDPRYFSLVFRRVRRRRSR